MPKPTDAMIASPFYQLQQQYEISRFLKIQPLALGILEILLGLLQLGLTIWNESFIVIWPPIIFITVGAIRVSAALKRTPRLVKNSQMLSYVVFVILAISLRGHIVYLLTTGDVSFYILITCDILIFIISLAVAITSCSCSCCCRSQMDQLYPSAVAQPVSSVMHELPATNGLVPPAPNYSHVPSASPPMYSPPSNYVKDSGALPPEYSPVQYGPPPAYEHEDFQTRI